MPGPKLVVGLGNPGRSYQGSRHNAGFRVADALVREAGASFRSAGGLRIARLDPAHCSLSVVKPVTSMNRSGDGLAPWLARRCLDLANLLVVHDDLDLPVGRLRFKRSGSAGGHRGVQSLIERLGDGGFPRLKIGVGRPPEGVDPIEYVLRRPDQSERALLDDAVARACNACLLWAREGLEAAMNVYNAALPCSRERGDQGEESR